MRYVLQPTTEHLHRFIAEREKAVLILRSSTADSLAILKLLEGLDDPHVSDLFWTFSDSFESPEAFVAKIVAAFSTKHLMVKLAMEQRGMEAWPDIPAEIVSGDMLPVERLRSLARFSRELLPIAFGGNSVWIFYPMQINDPVGYERFFVNFLEHSFPNPWFHNLRFIVREDPSHPHLSSSLQSSSLVDSHEPDLGPQAVASSIDREVNDEGLPLEQRLNSLTVQAGIDVAHGRFQAALDKYALLLEYYIPHENNTMIALALNGMGEVYVRLDDQERANQAFESALIPASHGEQPPWQIFLNAAMNLAQLRMNQQDWVQAAGYWEVVQQTAIITRDPSTKIRAYDQHGYCQYKMQDFEAAEASWFEGAQLAANVEDEGLFVTLMKRRQSLYSETLQFSKEQEVATQLEAMQ